MLLSAMSVLVVAQSSSEIPEGLMNNSVLFFFLSFMVGGNHIGTRVVDICSPVSFVA